MKKIILSAFALFLAIGMSAQIKLVIPSAAKVKQYEPIFFAVTFEGEKWDNPYLQEEAALDMMITTPSGKEIVLPAFFKGTNGGEMYGVWEARFTPQEKGKYTYHFRYTKYGENKSFLKKRGGAILR